MVSREQIHKAIDDLSPDNLEKVDRFVELLLAREHGSAWAKDFYDLLEPARQYVVDEGMTEDEINQLIDEALEEVRRERRT